MAIYRERATTCTFTYPYCCNSKYMDIGDGITDNDNRVTLVI